MLELSEYGEATIKIGSKNQDVSTLQNILQSKGFYSGDISGVFDTATKNAVINFQKANGLDVDGIVGPQTWSALTRKTTPQGTDLRPIIDKDSGGLIPPYIELFGTRIPILYLGIGMGALIGLIIYKRMKKRGEFE